MTQPPHSKRKRRNICFTVTEEHQTQLKELARQRNVTVSSLVRSALEEYLGQPMNTPKKNRGRGWDRSTA